ncbi:MAG TPA: ABC transporter substrate-binding protein [Ilumatobacteraceae bacterium]|nr:ABC transporter substrate-binding protein [Ilumatobacteraceae bacterium]
MIQHRKSLAAFATVGCLLLAAGCRSDGKGEASTTTAAQTTTTAAASTTAAPSSTTASSTPDSGAESTTTTADSTPVTDPAPEAWTVDVSNCADPDAATAPIEGEIKIGSAQPLSGTPAVAFAPVKAGIELYLAYANANNLIPDHTVSIDIRDDQYNPAETPGVVSALIDDGVNLFAGIIGSQNNLNVRNTLNDECYPQLLALTGSPDWGDIENYPWTTGALVPYDIEAKIYVDTMVDLGIKTTALFSVKNEFGNVFADAFKEAAAEAGIEVLDQQTIEPAETTPPTNQVAAIAGKKVDAIMAIPLGAQCPTFLKEVENAEAVNAGWTPKIFLTNTCASRLLISLLAGGAGDGVYTSTAGYDPEDPKYADIEGVVKFLEEYDNAGLEGDQGTTAVGWSLAQSVVRILAKASESGTLTRQSIIEAARSMEFTNDLAFPGAVYKLDGDADPWTAQSLQVVTWNEAAKTYDNVGDVVTKYEN